MITSSYFQRAGSKVQDVSLDLVFAFIVAFCVAVNMLRIVLAIDQ